MHPKYDDFNVVNDIALIKLKKKVNMTKRGVGLICLPKQGEATSLDSQCYITGNFFRLIRYSEIFRPY